MPKIKALLSIVLLASVNSMRLIEQSFLLHRNALRAYEPTSLQDKVMGNGNGKFECELAEWRGEILNGSTGTSNGLLAKGMLTEGHTPMYVYYCQPFTPQVRNQATDERYLSFSRNSPKRGSYLLPEA